MPEEVENERRPGDEADLLRRLRQGEEGAFEELLGLYQRDVYRVARRLTGSAAEADDVAQETFVRAWQGLPRFRGQAALRTWLMRIATNLSLNVRSSARLARRSPEPAEEAASVAPGAERALLESERQARLGAAIRKLPDRQRATLLLRVNQGMMFKEIARAMGCTTGTARANFFHAVANLRRALEDLSG